MAKIMIRHSDEVEPTLFQGRESRRLISPERDKSMRVSVHKICSSSGLSHEIRYPKNDEILYVLEGEGYIIEGDKKTAIKPGSIVFIPAETTYRIFSLVTMKKLAVLSPPRYRHEWEDRKDLVHLEPPFVSSSTDSE
jgi:mannose-6-phosphate isomerase-like protein (cupin superfamily)